MMNFCILFLGLASASDLEFQSTGATDCTFSHSASGVSSSCDFTSPITTDFEARISALETKVEALEAPEDCVDDSLVQNGGFENGAIGGIPAGWSRYNSYGNTGLISTDVAHCGSKSIKYTGTTWQLIENGGVNDQAAELELEAGKTYELTFWAYSTAANQHVRSEYLNYPGTSDSQGYYGVTQTTGDSPGTYVKQHYTAAANTWEKFTHTIKPNTGSSSRLNLGPHTVKSGLTREHLRRFFEDHDPTEMADHGMDLSTSSPHWDDELDNLLHIGERGLGDMLEETYGARLPSGALYLDDLSIAVVATESTCVTSDSMIKNGGVESGSNGNYATGWSRYSSYGNTGLVSNEVAHCGSNSLKFSGTSWQLVENGGVNNAAYAISLVGGQTYCLSAWVYGTAGYSIRTEFLKYGAHGDSDGYLGVLSTTPSGIDESYVKTHTLSQSNVWQEIEHCIIPTHTTNIVRMNVGPSSTGNTAMYLDDMDFDIL